MAAHAFHSTARLPVLVGWRGDVAIAVAQLALERDACKGGARMAKQQQHPQSTSITTMQPAKEQPG